MWKTQTVDLEKPFYNTENSGGCAYEEFWRREQENPPWMRSGACMLVCRCEKCQAKQPVCGVSTNAVLLTSMARL
jgi:hypothetical protein